MHLGTKFGGCQTECLAKAVVEVTLIEETDRQRHLAHRHPARQQPFALLQPQPFQPGVGGHAAALLELAQEGETVEPKQPRQLFQRVGLVEGGHQVVAQESQLGIRQLVYLGGQMQQLPSRASSWPSISRPSALGLSR